MIGMLLSQLRDPDLGPAIMKDILEIYQRVCGGTISLAGTPRQAAERASDQLAHHNEIDWELGSKLTYRDGVSKDNSAKLVIWNDRAKYEDGKHVDDVIRFAFDRNAARDDDRATHMTREFEYEVEKYLLRHEPTLAVHYNPHPRNEIKDQVTPICMDVGRQEHGDASAKKGIVEIEVRDSGDENFKILDFSFSSDNVGSCVARELLLLLAQDKLPFTVPYGVAFSNWRTALLTRADYVESVLVTLAYRLSEYEVVVRRG